MLVVLLIVLTIFVAVISRMAVYWGRHHNTKYKRALISERLPSMKSGDIILFITHTHGFYNSIFTGDLFTHCGMVVRKGGRYLISESTINSFIPDPKTKEKIDIPNEATLTPLLSRIKSYGGACFLMGLSRPLDASQESILDARMRERLPYPSFKLMILGLLGISVSHKARHCMQHVAWLLDEMGLVPETFRDAQKTLLGCGIFGTSRAIVGLPGEDLGSGFYYKQPVELLYDAGAR